MFRHKRSAHPLCLLPGLCLLAAVLSGCATMPGWMPSSGASREQVQGMEASSAGLEGVAIVNVDDALTRKLMAGHQHDRFSDVFGASPLPEYRVGPGDVIEIAIWEAPPAMLFGGVSLGATTVAVKSTQAETLPPQMVMEDGKITVPFAGRIPVAGRSVRSIESDVANRLQGQANKPQVIVRVAQNNTANVTVLGDTGKSAQIPLTPKGERLLDAIAKAGGVTQPVTSMSVRLSRQSVTATMPLDAVIRDPGHNIALMPGDVVTALFQPNSFSVFGAAGKNQEIPFEARGISLAQALARSGGLDDNRADARGVFVFRFEDAALVDVDSAGRPAPASTPAATPAVTAAALADGARPVIYQISLRDPASFFVTQNFPVRNHDVIYVANAPAAELMKFLRLIGAVISPGMTSTNFVNNISQ